MSTSVEHRLETELRVIGEALKEDPLGNAKEMRQRIFDLEELSYESGDPDLILKTYVLSHFVWDMWNNIGLSFSTEVPDKYQEELLHQTGVTFVAISNNISPNSSESFYTEVGKLLQEYHLTIEKLK